MEYLKDGYIYHVVTQRPMYIGQKIVFGQNKNSLFDRVMNWEFLNEEGQDCLELVSNKNFDTLNENDKKTIRTYIYENAMITREYILEQVRREKFPDYPSRFSCLYCVRNPEDTQIWVDVFSRMNRPVLQIVKMKATGKIFDGDAQKILRDAKSFGHKIALANKYWAGIDEKPLPECLFEGEVEIVEILKTFN